jgi:hypothetical protein
MQHIPSCVLLTQHGILCVAFPCCAALPSQHSDP